LARAKNWETKDGYPLETNTMPGFAGSSGYYLRYMDPKNDNEYFSKDANQYWQNVDLYIGGDGNLHPVICFDGTNPDEVKRVEETSAELFEKVIELGGTLTGEHGIGLAKIPFMALEHDRVSMDVMRSIKQAFDPNNILNPGKMGLEE